MTLTFSYCIGQLRSGSRPDPQVYKDLIHSYSNAGEFSTCFTELQRDFVSARPTKLKSLIRLVKHWYQQVRHGGHPSAKFPHAHSQRCWVPETVSRVLFLEEMVGVEGGSRRGVCLAISKCVRSVTFHPEDLGLQIHKARSSQVWCRPLF